MVIIALRIRGGGEFLFSKILLVLSSLVMVELLVLFLCKMWIIILQSCEILIKLMILKTWEFFLKVFLPSRNILRWGKYVVFVKWREGGRVLFKGVFTYFQVLYFVRC